MFMCNFYWKCLQRALFHTKTIFMLWSTKDFLQALLFVFPKGLTSLHESLFAWNGRCFFSQNNEAISQSLADTRPIR